MLEDTLIGNERIAYRAQIHPVIYSPAILCGVIAIGIFSLAAKFQIHSIFVNALGLLVILVGCGFASEAYLRITTSDFTVTDRRVMIQIGYLKRSSIEIFLAKVEGISIRQTFIGRILNFGDISIRGGGGIQEDFRTVSAPYTFRRFVQLLADAM